jgi:hypothetical protein
MQWRNAVASMALLSVFATESFAAERFACAEYFAATPAGQKKAEAGVKGTLVFDPNSQKVEFLNPSGGEMFHSGGGQPMDFDKLAQRVIRPVVELIGLEWYGWHGFRRGIASNLYELGADEKIVQRVLSHAKAHVNQGSLHRLLTRQCLRR